MDRNSNIVLRLHFKSPLHMSCYNGKHVPKLHTYYVDVDAGGGGGGGGGSVHTPNNTLTSKQ